MFTLDRTFKFKRRYKWSPFITITDIADYKVGWIFALYPFFMIMKLKTSKIMEAPKYQTFIEIFGIAYQRA
jgi:hypothetical protein